MASTSPGLPRGLARQRQPPGFNENRERGRARLGTQKGKRTKGKRIRINEVPLDYSAEMGRLTGKGTGILPARSYAEVPDDGFLHA
jgi:hypothetical protein